MRTELFGDGEDFLATMGTFEQSVPLRYVLCGMFNDPKPETFEDVFHIDQLGTSPFGDINLDPTYLLVRAGESVEIEVVPQVRGGEMYAIDQLANPRTIAFHP